MTVLPGPKVQHPDSCLLQFAKAPIAGQVKTRLQAALGEAGCLALHCALVKYQFEVARSAAVSNLELWCSAEHHFFHQLIEGSDARLAVQQGRDLGERMASAFADRLKKYNQVIIIGSDCPAIDGEYVDQALASLKDDVPAVFGPANDGGYVLVGLNRLNLKLFSDIPWGSGEVMAVTRNRLNSLGWRWEELPSLADIDRPEDLGGLSNFAGLHKGLVGF
ncbi:MAG: rSAM/selenodomain-associated transferase 1 [Porticoccus sp.]|jgi:rSAM/selenodomain-associated transferase 1